ncbi:rRNA N6-adenosine-methyltransferase ZCCHC4 [Nematostella vectensis]|uniref:rRNA N6-adenosine-methyltransferase ZCCHC4 n=1 Tax=Nematostella vectensis TaxID=45351 RepID=UPI002076D74F|nr:rRNA N6-adenosine-methyltransferase ZCCHC4 [Nematostella vectensis]
MATQHAATERLGVSVYILQGEGREIPECPHGPMLLFERFFKDGREPRLFFACSACRDRKACSFFQWEDETLSDVRKKAHQDIITASRPNEQQLKIDKELRAMMEHKSKECSWLYCHSCDVLVTRKTPQHIGHDVTEGQTLSELRKPSIILKPLQNQKVHAQYLFSVKATTFIVNTIKKLEFKKVLCLGTPRIHGMIQCTTEAESSLDSLLLDIDHRYGMFNLPSKFCWYNMFNHHFFNNNKSEQQFNKFLENADEEEIVMIMDPPFGGLVEVLGATLQKIWKLWRTNSSAKDNKKEMATMFIFPYFMETQIQAALPSMKMLDYKVDYDNHPLFKDKKAHGSKRGSPVRIFTNIPAANVKLPSKDGYRFCKPCQRYVSAENYHCSKCDACTSKDGRRYVHCEDCVACVKPGHVHCFTCKRCEPPGHECNRKVSTGCHICGEDGHKRRDCPQRIKTTSSHANGQPQGPGKSPGKRKKQPRKSAKKKKQKTN